MAHLLEKAAQGRCRLRAAMIRCVAVVDPAEADRNRQ